MPRPDLLIERMQLNLPSDQLHQARAIAREVTEQLAALPLSGSAIIDRLVVPALNLSPTASPSSIAAHIAASIGGQLGLRQTDGGGDA
jgi:hypothetical protein